MLLAAAAPDGLAIDQHRDRQEVALEDAGIVVGGGQARRRDLQVVRVPSGEMWPSEAGTSPEFRKGTRSVHSPWRMATPRDSS
jgi:hypothetical protein